MPSADRNVVACAVQNAIILRLSSSASIKRIATTVHPRAAVGAERFFLILLDASNPTMLPTNGTIAPPPSISPLKLKYPSPMHHRRNVGDRQSVNCFFCLKNAFSRLVPGSSDVHLHYCVNRSFPLNVFSHCLASLSAAPLFFCEPCAHRLRSKTASSFARS